ncbi:MAG: GNAT family N-acetyltransferase [Nocardioides sp.]|uniref:GNAT family N-acetyltransferase n=1 Tax=Nocardioides sp. TaxID=35761 RepID=UPI003EFF3532
MHARSLGYRTDLALLTATGSTVEDRGTHLVVRTPANPTYFWGNFILLAAPPVPGGEKEVVGAFHTEFPEAGHVSIGIDTGEIDDDARKRWEAAGLTVDSSVVLTASALHQPLTPLAAVTVRPLDSDEDWVQRALLSYTLSPTTPQDTFLVYQRARDAHERALVEAGSGHRFGAFLGDELVATAAVFRTEPGVARFQNVETHAAHRRQGIGASVVHAAGTYALAELGVTQLVMVADEEGPAIGMYRRLGFADSERQVALERRGEGWSEA